MRRLLSFVGALALLAQPVFASGFSSTLASSGGSGTVTSVGVTTANGVSGTVANPTTTPAISVTLGAITPSSVAASGTVTGSNLSGTNTGNQTITLTGDVTGSGTGSFAATVAPSAVTYAKIQNVAATSLLGNPTGSAAAPSELTLAGGLSFSGTTLRGAVVHPGYIANNWYSPLQGVTVGAGTAPGSGSIRLLPFTLSKPITIQALAARVTTISASGNFQLAEYANNAATGRPTGTALCTTGNISTGSTGPVSGAATCTGTLAPGTYWMAINQDNSTAVYQTITAATTDMAFLIGSATLANVTSATAGANLALSVTQTFGTWPDLTSASFTEATNVSSALVFMEAQ